MVQVYTRVETRPEQCSDPQLMTKLLNPDGCCYRRCDLRLIFSLLLYPHFLGKKKKKPQIPTETNTFSHKMTHCLVGDESYSLDDINLAYDDVPPASRPNQLKICDYTHRIHGVDFVPRACQSLMSVSCFQLKGHEICYEVICL